MNIKCALTNIVKKRLIKSLYGIHEILFDNKLFNQFYVNKLHTEKECVPKYHIKEKCLDIPTCEDIIIDNCDLDVSLFYAYYPTGDRDVYINFYVTPVNNIGETTWTVTQYTGFNFVETGTNSFTDLTEAVLPYEIGEGDIIVVIKITDEVCTKTFRFIIYDYIICGEKVPEIIYSSIGTNKYLFNIDNLTPGTNYTFLWGVFPSNVASIQNQPNKPTITTQSFILNVLEPTEFYQVCLLVYDTNNKCTYHQICKFFNEDES